MDKHHRLFLVERLTCFVLTFVLLFIGLAPASAQQFTIDRFRSDITIRPDSSMIVRETIEVAFQRPKHGILRKIPFRYRDEFGKTFETPIKVLSVTNGAGRVWKYEAAKRGAALQIRIGDPRRYVEGHQAYTITYSVENGILFFNDHDELYWNVTGHEWQANIEEASAEVTLVTEKKSKQLWVSAYTGRPGSTRFNGVSETSENGAKFSTNEGLLPGEGLTIAFGWEKGLVAPPSSWKRFLWAVHPEENWIFLVPVLSFIYMFFQWRAKGRDPKVKEAVMVTYEPPRIDHRTLSPGEVGTLLDERLDPRDITSTIVGLGVKGYLQIEERNKEGIFSDTKDFYLKKVKDPDSTLGPFEVELMQDLFPAALPGVLVSSLKNSFYTHLDRLKRALYEELVRRRFFLSNPEKVRNLYTAAGIVVLIFGGLFFTYLISQSLIKGIAVSALTAIPVFAFGRVMPAKTRSGAQAYMEILGFQEFMMRAEKDRLERMADPNLFTKFLPYAIALDVVDHWAEAFKDIYQDPPDWYVSPGGFRSFHPIAFTRSFQSVTSTLTSSVYSAPRGSGLGGGGGFRGGGSSGGGFGGGGGGSW